MGGAIHGQPCDLLQTHKLRDSRRYLAFTAEIFSISLPRISGTSPRLTLPDPDLLLGLVVWRNAPSGSGLEASHEMADVSGAVGSRRASSKDSGSESHSSALEVRVRDPAT
jgi:hypothetical protein